MITLAATVASLVGVLWLWIRWRSHYPALALRYLCLAPFFPVVSLLNHNLDGDRFGAAVRTAPVFGSLAMLLLSLFEWRMLGNRVHLGRYGGYLGVYAVLALAQVPFSVDPTWALFAWEFSVPGYFLMFAAGRATRVEDLVLSRRRILLVLVGFVGINAGLVTIGLATGRATNLFNTRNFGSVWASNSLLAFIVLFGGLVWIAIRASRPMVWVFSVTVFVGIGLSLSRSALIASSIYLALIGLAWRVPAERPRPVRSRFPTLAAAVLTLAVPFLVFRQRLGLDAQLVGNWSDRLRLSGGGFGRALALRMTEFGPYANTVWHTSPLYGQGFGSFGHFSIYSDAHNLFLTEAFENGLVAAAFLALAIGVPMAVRSISRRSVRPLALSIFGFLVFAEITGAMLSYRAVGSYYAVYQGWTLFFMVGVLAGKRSSEVAAVVAETVSKRADPVAA